MTGIAPAGATYQINVAGDIGVLGTFSIAAPDEAIARRMAGSAVRLAERLWRHAGREITEASMPVRISDDTGSLVAELTVDAASDRDAMIMAGEVAGLFAVMWPDGGGQRTSDAAVSRLPNAPDLQVRIATALEPVPHQYLVPRRRV
jgi:hypothetical protein